MRTMEDLVSSLEELPILRARVEKILDIAKNKDNLLIRADDVEERVDEEIQKLAREVMQGWAETENKRQASELRQKQAVTGDGKKNSTGTRSSAQ